MTNCFEIIQEGGAWLGAVRSWIQLRFRNGSEVTWGSEDRLGEVSVKDIENVAARAVATYINEDAKRENLVQAAKFALRVIDGDLKGSEMDEVLAAHRLQNALDENC